MSESTRALLRPNPAADEGDTSALLGLCSLLSKLGLFAGHSAPCLRASCSTYASLYEHMLDLEAADEHMRDLSVDIEREAAEIRLYLEREVA